MHHEFDFDEDDYEFFRTNFIGPRRETYKKCYCGKYYEGNGFTSPSNLKIIYCDENCPARIKSSGLER